MTLTYALSRVQARIWRQVGDREARVSGHIRIEGVFDQERWKQSVSTVVSQHEIMQATFDLDPDLSMPVARVHGTSVPGSVRFTLIRSDADT